MILSPVRILGLYRWVRAKRAIERRLQRPRLKFRGPPSRNPSGRTLEPRDRYRALDVLHWHPAGETRGDDRTGRRATDEIEIVAKQQARVVSPLAKKGLDDLEIFERENAPDATAVERENAFWVSAGSRCWALVSGNGVVSSIKSLSRRLIARQKPISCNALLILLRSQIVVKSDERFESAPRTRKSGQAPLEPMNCTCSRAGGPPLSTILRIQLPGRPTKKSCRRLREAAAIGFVRRISPRSSPAAGPLDAARRLAEPSRLPGSDRRECHIARSVSLRSLPLVGRMMKTLRSASCQRECTPLSRARSPDHSRRGYPDVSMPL